MYQAGLANEAAADHVALEPIKVRVAHNSQQRLKSRFSATMVEISCSGLISRGFSIYKILRFQCVNEF